MQKAIPLFQISYLIQTQKHKDLNMSILSVYHLIAFLLGAEAIVLLGLLLPIKFLNKLVIAGLWKTKYYLNGLLIFLVLFSAYETQHLVRVK